VTRRPLGLVLALGLVAQPLQAQLTIGSGVDYLGYSFDPGLGADAAQLLLVPVAVRVPIADFLTFDIYSAWAEGRVEQDNTQYVFSGPVDTNVKASIQATPWALLSVGANLPNGNSTHTGEEAVVASVLSTDLLGFKEANWGTGFALTSSVATAAMVGGFGVGVAGAYALREQFRPTEGAELEYNPGSETRVRVGLDRNFGTSTLTLGGTFITYTTDQADGRNLFQAGNRLRFDASLAFRAGDGVWTLYAADVMRDHGDLTLDIADAGGAIVGDTAIATAKQNMAVGGIIGTVGLGHGFIIRPHFDFKYQAREEADGNDAGTGWIFSGGADMPLRLFGGMEFFPKARVFFGTLRGSMGNDVNLIGLELKGTLRLLF